MLGLDIAHLHTKFDDCCFSRSRDMVGVHQNLNGSSDMATFLSGTGSHLWASTCYDQHINQLFELSTSSHYEDMKSDTKYRK